MHPFEQTATVNDVHLFWTETPAQEWAFGYSDAIELAMEHIRDREEFLRLLDALEHSITTFLLELRSARFAAVAGIAILPLDEFESLMFGPGAKGVRGHYGRGFVAAFAALAPFVASLH